MSDGQVLYLILAALYLLECVQWAPSVSWIFRQTATGRFRSVPATKLPETLLGVPCPALPIPPLGGIHLAPPPLWLPTGKGILFGSLIVLPGTRSLVAAPTFVPYDGVGSASADGGTLRLQAPALRLRVGSHRLAHAGARLIQDLRRASIEERPARIAEEQSRALDRGVYEERLRRFRELVRAPRTFAQILFVGVFVVAPVVISQWNVLATWLAVLAATLLLTTAIAVLFTRAHRSLSPEQRQDRWIQAFLIALCPTVAIRVGDRLQADALGGAHPALVAALLLEPEERRRTFGALLREYDHPVRRPPDDIPADVTAAIEEARDAERLAVERFMMACGDDPDALRAIDPGAFGPGTLAYCPRCLEPFVERDRTCPGCALPIQPIELAAGRRPAA